MIVRFSDSQKIHIFVFKTISINATMIKGILSQDGLSTETIDVKFRPKQSAANVSCTWIVSRQNNKQETCRCKMTGTGIQSSAKLRAQIVRGMPQTAWAFKTCWIPLSNKPRNANHHSPMNCGMPTP
jgi:hypothetical protein